MSAQSLTTRSRTSRPAPRLIAGSIAAAALAVAAVGFSGGSASADDNMDTEANVEVEGGITLSALTADFTLTGIPGETVDTVTPVTYNVETNNPTGYTVTVQSDTATMVPADIIANPETIDIGVLTVIGTTGGYQPVTAGPDARVLVHTQPGRSIDGGDVLSTDYQMSIPNVAADTYSATLNYLAAPIL